MTYQDTQKAVQNLNTCILQALPAFIDGKDLEGMEIIREQAAEYTEKEILDMLAFAATSQAKTVVEITRIRDILNPPKDDKGEQGFSG
jgi:hypothetical protein